MQSRILTLSDRLTQFARRGRDQAERLQPGKDRDDLLQKVRQAEVAIHINQWVSSPGLRAPT